MRQVERRGVEGGGWRMEDGGWSVGFSLKSLVVCRLSIL